LNTVDRVGFIETQGIQPVDPGARHGRPRELFWLWFASNFGILGVVYGGILVTYGINLWQALLVVVVATVLSYGLVGLVSLAGPRHGRPTLAFSGKVFGERGNAGPAVVSWLTLVGWETIALVVATYALIDLAGLPALVALGVNVALLAFLGVLGHATLIWTSRIVTVVFGLLTVLAAVFVAVDQDWAAVAAQPAGPWGEGVVAALTIVAAGTGLTWVNCGADFTRYLPGSSCGRAVVGWTIAGALPAVLITILMGFVLSGGAGSDNPVAMVRAALPAWMAGPILVTAVVGLLTGAATALYSSGMSLLALGLRVPRYVSVLVDGVLAFAAATYVLLVAQDFVTSLQNFLQLATIGLVAWAGVVLVWLAVRAERATPAAAMVAWLAGIVAGVLFSSSPLFTGPLAVGIFAVSGLGYLVSLAVSGALYWVAVNVRGRTG
jgi:nucleobase:cation symporter-1, NCS1 family